MNREFRELYNRELGVLEESAREFAEEFPGVAERLGGLTRDAMDPMIKGLLEGAAFLAARVQLKIKHEFPEFTNNLLEQLVPHYLAPTPSTTMVSVAPPFDDPNLKDGIRIEGGTYLDARYVERERRVACRYRLATALVLWPIDITYAEFISQRASLAALGIETGADIASGLQLSLIRRSTAALEDEPKDDPAQPKPELLLSACKVPELTVRILGDLADSVRLYERLFCNIKDVYVRYLDDFENPVVFKAPPGCIKQVGLEHEEPLLPGDNRVFRGFDLLREMFILPQKFMGFRITGLQDILPRIRSRRADIIITFDRPDARLPSVVRARTFSLYAVSAANLFEMQAGRIAVKPNEYEHQIVPDRGRYLDFEPHRVVRIYAHFLGTKEKLEVFPLYSAPPENIPESSAIFYTVRRLMRKRTVEEHRLGKSSNYTGTDMFLSIAPNPKALEGRDIAELSVRAMCSNRHLTEHLPVGEGGADFTLESNTKLPVTCIAGPTPPRESIINRATDSSGASAFGSTAWRLINLLRLNHLGLTGRGTTESAATLRELLTLFADTSDNTTERQIRGIMKVESQPIVRRVRQADGSGVARGLEVTITFDEKAFEGSGLFLFGAVLDRFLAEYAPINSFVQTVVRSNDRGEVKRWPPRVGNRVTL